MKRLNFFELPSTKVHRWYISLNYFWQMYAIVFIPVVYVEIHSYSKPGSLLEMESSGLHNIDDISLLVKWIVIKLMAGIVLFIAFTIAKYAFRLRNLHALSGYHIFIVGILSGLCSGYTQYFLIQRLEVFDVGTIFARIISPVALATCALFSLSTVTSNIRKYRRESDLANIELENILSIQSQQKEVVDDYRDFAKRLSGKVSRKSDEALRRVDEISKRQNLFDENIGKEIRLISDSTIRQLSHELENQYKLTHNDKSNLELRRMFLHYLRLIHESIHFAPLNPFIFTSSFVLFVSGGLIRHAEWDQAILTAVGLFLTVSIVQVLGVIVYKRFHIQNELSVIVVIVFSGLSPLFLLKINFMHFTDFVPDINKYPPSPILLLLSLLAVTILGYAGQAGLIENEHLFSTRMQKVKNTKYASKKFDREFILITRNWARHLHGPIQSQILASTLILEQAQKGSDLAAVRFAMDEVARTLAKASVLEDWHPVELDEELKRRCQSWGKLVSIDLIISPEIKDQSGYQTETIADVVEEMIANAARHGLASKIRIEVAKRNPTQLSITAIDNGSIFERTKKGFGSRFFDEVSFGRWDISRNRAFGETTVSILMDLENYLDFHHDLP
jgi:signal transduction histidine kinase